MPIIAPRLFPAAAAALLALTTLGGCAAGGDATAASSTAAAAPQPDDQALTCPQIEAGIADQNQIIQQANGQGALPAAADGGGVMSGSEDAPGPSAAQVRKAKAAAAAGPAAVARANTLLALGRQKSCFR